MAGSDFSEIRRLAQDLSAAAESLVPRIGLAISKTTKDIEADAKILAPVDTGNLRNSISASYDHLGSEIGPTAEYGLYVEEGTSRMAPQPYLGPAFDRRIGGLEDALTILASEIL